MKNRANPTPNSHRRAPIPVAVGVLLLLSIVAPLVVGEVTVDPQLNLSNDPQYIEDFEGYPAVAPPGGSEYSHGTAGSGGSSFVTTSIPGPDNSSATWKIDDNGNTFAAGLRNWAYDWCAQGTSTHDYWVRFSSVTNPNMYIGLGTTASNSIPDNVLNGQFLGIYVKASGAVDMVHQPINSASPTTGSLGMNVAADTWYHFRVTWSVSACDGGGSITVAELTTETQGSLSISGLQDFQNIDSFVVASKASSTAVYFDNVTFPKIPDTPPAITAEDSAALTDITDIEADADIQAFLVKYNGGSDLATYNPLQLSSGAKGTQSTTCVFDNGGIATNLNQVVYVDCSGTTPNEIVLTDLFFAEPEWPGACAAACDGRFPIPDDNVNQMAVMDGLQSLTVNEGGVQVTYNYITVGFRNPTDNNIHVARLAHNDDGDDFSVHKETLYSGGAGLQEVCSSHDDTYWAAGGELIQVGLLETSNPVIFSINKQFETGFTGTNDVKCSRDAVAFKSGGVITVMNKIGPTDKRVINVNPAKFAISKDSAFLYTSDGDIYNVDNGTLVGSTEVPAGTLVDVFIDNTAQNVWYVTDSGITQFSIYPVTTGTPESTTAGGGFTDPIFGGGGGGTTTEPGKNYIVDTPDESDPDGVLGKLILNISNGFGFDPTATRALLGLTFTAVIAGAMGSMGTGNGTVLMGSVGVMIGAAVALFLGLWPVWVMLLLVLVVVAIVGHMVFGGGGKGDE